MHHYFLAHHVSNSLYRSLLIPMTPKWARKTPRTCKLSVPTKDPQGDAAKRSLDNQKVPKPDLPMPAAMLDADLMGRLREQGREHKAVRASRVGLLAKMADIDHEPADVWRRNKAQTELLAENETRIKRVEKDITTLREIRSDKMG
jgi:hypothetical protein